MSSQPSFSEDLPDHNPFADAVSPHSQAGTPTRSFHDVFPHLDPLPTNNVFSDVSINEHPPHNDYGHVETPLYPTESASKPSELGGVFRNADEEFESLHSKDEDGLLNHDETPFQQSWQEYPQSVQSEPSHVATPDPPAIRPQSPTGAMTDVTLQEEIGITEEASHSPDFRRQPLFEVTVGEPTKSGDNINPFIMYKIRTKTTVAGFRSNDFFVTRRYSDFLWLYNQLTAGNPGIIVPPPPEKHALGRFAEDFIEARRVALERCLQKITSHPLLYGDPDLKLFLESEYFTAKEQKKDSRPGLIKAFGEAVSNATGGFVKFAEIDEWFGSRQSQLDVLETQLKSLMKAVNSLVKQRIDVGGTNADFGESIDALLTAEANKPLSNDLKIFGRVQRRLSELHQKQAGQDISTLENTVDEYIRLIGSIKVTFAAREKRFQTWHTAETELQKKRLSLEKHRAPGRSRPEKIQHLKAEVLEMEMKVSNSRREFDDVSKLIRSELERFDEEKVEDFKAGIEGFVNSMVTTQTEIIKLWENYIAWSQKRIQKTLANSISNEQISEI